MKSIEIIKPTSSEWTVCQEEVPQACRGIARLERKAETVKDGSSVWRNKLDHIRQAVDEVAGGCAAFNHCHRKGARIAKLEVLPCQTLRREIVEDRLGGSWEEHNYDLPVGRG